MQVLAWCGGAVLLSTLSYPLLQLARERKWCKFVGSSPHEFKAQLRGQLPSARSSFNSLADADEAGAARYILCSQPEQTLPPGGSLQEFPTLMQQEHR